MTKNIFFGLWMVLGVMFCGCEDKDIRNLPPQAFEVSVSEINFHSAMLSWTAPEDPEGDQLQYSLYLENNLITDTLTAPQIRLHDLTPDFNYSGKVIARDPAGNQSIAEFSFVSTSKNIPGENFDYPVEVFVKTRHSGHQGPNYGFSDSIWYTYNYESPGKISTITRIMRSYELAGSQVTLKAEKQHRFDFSYSSRLLDIRVTDVKNNGAVTRQSTFHFNNERYIFPGYSTHSGTDYDSAVYTYSDHDFLMQTGYYLNSKLIRTEKFPTTETTINIPWSRVLFKYTDIPSSVGQFNGLTFPVNFDYSYRLGNVDPITFPLRMFRSSDVLVSEGGQEWGFFYYEFTNGKLTSSRYSCSQISNVGSTILYKY